MDPKIPISEDDWQRLQNAPEEEDSRSKKIETLIKWGLRVYLVAMVLCLFGLCAWIYWYIVLIQEFKFPPGW